MKTKKLQLTALLALLMTLANFNLAIGQNMSRYIELTVQQGQQINLNFKADAANTPVKVVSGTYTKPLTVGTGWSGYQNYTAQATTMRVYGDITGFGCSANHTKITGVDASHNTALKELYCNYNELTSLDISQNTALKELNCSLNQLTSLDVSQNTALKDLRCYDNSFTTQVIDDIYCSLPQRQPADNAVIYPLFSNTNASADTIVLATRKQNAIDKGWKVQYYYDETDIPATTGTYVCGTPIVNMNRYIELTVQQGQQIRLRFQAGAANTPVKVVSGTYSKTFTVGTNWTGFQNHTAQACTMKVYGDITGFDCSENESKVTNLDASHNTALEELACNRNQLTSLDISQNTALYYLNCQSSQLTSLNVSQNTALRTLFCNSNQLTSLDLSHNTALYHLDCQNNQLTSLNVSQNTALMYLSCFKNNFTTQAIDDIYCSLPQRQPADNARIFPVSRSTDPNHALVLATNKQNAMNKGWKVQYYSNNTDIPATTGSYTCPAPVNTNCYIELTVTAGQQIYLRFKADSANTLVKVVSGTYSNTLTVGTKWTYWTKHTAQSTTMRIYGNVVGFDCGSNGSNITGVDASNNMALEGLYCNDNQLTSLDLSQNTALMYLGCFKNNLTTQAIDDIYCSLPQRQPADNAKIYPVDNPTDINHALVLATNKQNAMNKGWKVQYYSNNTDIPATTGSYVCPAPVNMSRYIELTVKPGSSIRLSLMADAKDTPVKVVSGTAAIRLRASSEHWIESTYNAQAGTMRIYGDVAGFDCSENDPNITGLDVSHNTALEELTCYSNQLTTLDVSQNTALEFLDCSVNQLTALDVSTNTALKQLFCGDNNFTSQAIDDIYCALPHRQAADNAIIYPLFDSTDTNHALVLATNKQNAIDKNWKVQYINTYEDIPATTGTYMCSGSTPPVNMNRYIELTVKPGSNIWFALYAQQSDTPVKIVSGTAETPLRATEDWIELTHIAQAGTIRVYGDVAGFDCGDNEPNVTGLDVSHNTALEYLSCYGNQLTTLNVSQNTALIWLYCQDNQLTTLDVSKNTALKKLWCLRNSLSALDISQNTALIELLCDGNNLTTQAIDDIYCSLPQRQPADNAKIYPVDNPTDINHALVLATNKQNAINKGWRVLYRNDTDIPATTGTYVCTTTGVESVESAVSIYPNPAKDFITIATDDVIGSAITITDLAGRTVMTTTATDTMTTLDVSRLGAGTYIIRVGDKTAKIVKM